ncbi:uncharacterized, partial [Tachysurus ichikawai]
EEFGVETDEEEDDKDEEGNDSKLKEGQAGVRFKIVF